MSDTPEADKQWAEFLNKLEKPIDVFVDFARKLERERNEAREDAKRATYDATHETIKLSTVKSHWIEACRERDEAREVAENLVEYAHECLVRLESWGKGYDRYEREMETIREAIAGCQKWKEAAR